MASSGASSKRNRKTNPLRNWLCPPLSHTYVEKAWINASKRTIIVGRMRSHKITSDNFESGVRMPKSALHALH